MFFYITIWFISVSKWISVYLRHYSHIVFAFILLRFSVNTNFLPLSIILSTHSYIFIYRHWTFQRKKCSSKTCPPIFLLSYIGPYHYCNSFLELQSWTEVTFSWRNHFTYNSVGSLRTWIDPVDLHLAKEIKLLPLGRYVTWILQG